MPLYSYRCLECSKVVDAVRAVDERHDCPKCNRCYGTTEKILTPTMVSVFNTYQTIAQDKETGKRVKIGSRAEHQAFLRRNGYEEVGNDKSMAPPRPEEVAARKKKWRDAQDAPMVDVEKLKQDGWIKEDLTV